MAKKKSSTSKGELEKKFILFSWAGSILIGIACLLLDLSWLLHWGEAEKYVTVIAGSMGIVGAFLAGLGILATALSRKKSILPVMLNLVGSMLCSATAAIGLTLWLANPLSLIVG